MRNYLNNGYTPGTYKRECDVCGFNWLRSEMFERWDNAIVCPKCNEPKPDNLRKLKSPTEKPFKRD